MTPPFHIGFLVFAAVVCGVGGLSRLIQSVSCIANLPSRDEPWPWFIRAPIGPARLLAPQISRLVPTTHLAHISRRLEAADLHPGLDATEWVALRVIHGLLAAASATAVCVATGLPLLWWMVICASAGYLCGGLWLRSEIAQNERGIVRELPPYLDMLTVCVEAGATLTAAVRLLIEQAPPSPLRKYFERVLREVRSGRTRAQAFVGVADGYGVESLSTLASALAHAEAAGMSIGTVLRSQSEQRSAERFVRAEKLALEAPVKMLGPLIFCIFPCTFIVLAVPIAHRLLEVLHS
jgi:tight adherence protein C